MAERFSAGEATGSKILTDKQTHELKLGSSFDKNVYSAFHTIRYDFKPASVDTTKDATLEVGKSNGIKVTVPHVEGAGAKFTYRGNKKPVQKECVLIIDNQTGEITLERLCSTMHLKKQRLENSSKTTAGKAHTTVEPAKLSPPGSQPSGRKEPTPPAQQEAGKDFSPFTSALPSPVQGPCHLSPTVAEDLIMSSSDSDSSSDEENHPMYQKNLQLPGRSRHVDVGSDHREHKISSNQGLMSQLCEDLQLSESGSDSD